MLERIIEIDRSLFMTLNHIHSPFFDGVMVFASEKFVWVPLYLAIIFFVFFRIENKQIQVRSFYPSLIILVCILLTFAMTDMISADIIKGSVHRLRPGHDPELANIVRLLDGKGGLYGFVSSHAANVFGLALFTSLSFKKRWYTVFIFAWAALVSYSRIYVGRHFPLDVVCGAFLGLISALLVFTLARLVCKRFNIK